MKLNEIIDMKKFHDQSNDPTLSPTHPQISESWGSLQGTWLWEAICVVQEASSVDDIKDRVVLAGDTFYLSQNQLALYSHLVQCLRPGSLGESTTVNYHPWLFFLSDAFAYLWRTHLMGTSLAVKIYMTSVFTSAFENVA